MSCYLCNGIYHQARDASRRQTKAAAESAVVAEPGVFYFLLAVPHPVPWIVSLLSNDFLEAAADEKLHGVEAGLIHMAQDRVHHPGGHVVRPKARVTVPQRGVNDPNFFHGDLLKGS